VTNVASATDKRGEDHVNPVLDTELEIANILFRKSGKVNVSAGQVDTLSGRDVAIVQALDTKGLIVNNLEHLKRENTVVHIDQLAGFDDLGDVLVVEVPAKFIVSSPIPRMESLRFPGTMRPNNARIFRYTYMFLSSQAVAYFSSVVMLSSWPAWIGMSLSPTVFPVRISGPF
jgi:hypothetical protein